MISIVLMEPRHPGNVGAIARAMHNFGFDKLVLVDPLCSHLHPDAKRRAKHGISILENATRISKDQLRDSFHTLVATTALIGSAYNLPRVPLTPWEFVEISKPFHHVEDEKLGLLMGREHEGLHNDEIELCDYTVTIPCPKDNPTLNLSHATTILLYELSKHRPQETTIDHIDLISDADMKQLNVMINSVIDSFSFETPEKQETQRLVWKRLFAKSCLSKREAFAIMGLLRKIIDRK